MTDVDYARRKAEVIKTYATKAGDTGSPEVQVAILSERINNLTEHSRPTSRTTIPGVACSSSCPSVASCSTISSAPTKGVTRR